MTNTVLLFLERQGIDTAELLEAAPLPGEFLRDPSYWLDASDTENFLNESLLLAQSQGLTGFIHTLGAEGPQLRSWGVLDSVLRMIPQPQEVWSSPEQFLSYFISPQPPVENLEKSPQGLAFDIAITSQQYPLITQYLAAAFENIPLFMGLMPIQCRWNDIRVELSWKQEQVLLFGTPETPQISFETLRSVVSNLQKHQQELEEKNKIHSSGVTSRSEKKSSEKKSQALASLNMNFDFLTEDESLEATESVATAEAALLRDSDVAMGAPSEAQMKQQLSKLQDYWVRSQQLISLLMTDQKTKPAVQNMVRKLRWPQVESEAPKTIDRCFQIIAAQGNNHRKNESLGTTSLRDHGG